MAASTVSDEVRMPLQFRVAMEMLWVRGGVSYMAGYRLAVWVCCVGVVWVWICGMVVAKTLMGAQFAPFVAGFISSQIGRAHV